VCRTLGFPLSSGRAHRATRQFPIYLSLYGSGQKPIKTLNLSIGLILAIAILKGFFLNKYNSYVISLLLAI
jgi:hypothetical protein